MNLRECQSKWFDLYDQMDKFDAERKMAAPFLSVAGESYPEGNVGPLLLVGKATAGCWKLDEYLFNANCTLDERIDERQAVTRNHLECMKGRQPSAFWRFWRDLQEIGSPVIWTNVAKIGVVRGNPGGRYRSAQSELAIVTLKAEIEEYSPSLVVIVGDYAGNEIICPVFTTVDEWQKNGDGEFYWLDRDRTAGRPPVLWVDHPERKRSDRVRLWLEKARELYA